MSTTHVPLEVRPSAPAAPGSRRPWTAGHVAAAALAVLMAAASAGGVFAPGFYTDDTWASAAFRGTDLATLVVAVPVLVGALALSLRGSARARLVTLGMLAYGTYDYAFYVFGAAWSDWFLLHVATFVVALYGTVLLAATTDPPRVVVPRRTRRAVAAYTAFVGMALGGLWAYVSLRYALTGDLDAGTTPADAMHVIFAIDLTVMAPALVLAAVLLWRGARHGLVAAVATNVVAAVYQVALSAGAQFQADAGVAGKTWLSPSGIVVAVGSAVAVGALLRHVRDR